MMNLTFNVLSPMTYKYGKKMDFIYDSDIDFVGG